MVRKISLPRQSHLVTLFLVVLMSVFAGCEAEETVPIANKPPETSVPNIPPQGWDFENPIQVLQWSGNDPDGFIVAYRYRWSYILPQVPGVQYRPFVYLMNFMPGRASGKLAVIMEGGPEDAVRVYDVLRVGIDTSLVNALAAGDTLILGGVPVFASNPDGEPYPVHINPNTGTFLFESQDSVNPHSFEVAAIDDQGAIDATPAVLDFTSPLVEPPAVWIRDSARYAFDTLLVLSEFTDTFEGIEFNFGGSTTTQKIEYSYIVDRDLWPAESLASKWSPFSENPTVRLKASDFKDQFALAHTIAVRGRNEFGSISNDTIDFFLDTTNGRYFKYFTEVSFNTIYPEFAGGAKRILVMNDSYDWETTQGGPQPPMRPARSVVTQYYRDLYASLGLSANVDFIDIHYDTLSAAPSGTFPTIGEMGQYSMLHLVGDVNNVNFRIPSITAGTVGKLLTYLNVGGKLLINGWNLSRPDNFPQSDDAWKRILHFQTQSPAVAPEYVGAKFQPLAEATQYPDAPLDLTKLDPLWDNALPRFYTFQPYGFGEIIYRYDSKNDVPLLEGNTVGIRYLGLTYDVIFLGFPLYYTEQPAAVEVLRKALRDLDHLTF